MSTIEDPCLVAGTLVAARFFPDRPQRHASAPGVTIRRGFENHDKVRRWLKRFRIDDRDVNLVDERTFKQLMHDSMSYND